LAIEVRFSDKKGRATLLTSSSARNDVFRALCGARHLICGYCYLNDRRSLD
jgi:hypothetical protein